MRRIGHWIGGSPVYGAPGSERGPVFDPATGQQEAEVDFASAAEVDAAVRAAASAFPAWSAQSLSRRAEILFTVRAALASRRHSLAQLVTAENGKLLADAEGEVARGLENVEFACGAPHLLKGEYSERTARDLDVYSIHQPLGVVAGITPFNFPAMVPLWMLANAIACGNTFVLKPSEKDPSPAQRLAEILREAGVPDGVFNVVNGGSETAARLIQHPEVAAISFVGSTPVARGVYEAATRAGKRVQALGGAKNHMVVLPDADLELAADAAASAAYGAAGQRCMAVSVLVAVGGIADRLVSALADRAEKLRIGAGSDPASEMGPLVTRAHRDRVASYLELGAQEGAALVVDGRTRHVASDGFFLGASLLDHVRPEMRVYTDEIFGPVLCVVRASNAAEAIRLVNANPYGNGAAIFTRDGGAARHFQSEVDVGMVGINVPIPVPASYYSFGGWKQSLFGDTHVYGPEGIRFYTRTKVVSARWPSETAAARGTELSFPTLR
jgi:malonate-semialdehyde dehydrogenase (acetylating)/methylmalonate-semialdehyde dehydrogenase